MRILVLGASGFLGSYLGYYLKKKGFHVVGLSRRRSRLSNYTQAIVEGSIANYAQVIEDVRPDVVINCIALTSHEICESRPNYAQLINSYYPAAWAKSSRKCNSFYIHISTDAVFDGNSNKLYEETDTTIPKSIYGQTKLGGELLVMESNPKALILRTNFFGWSYNGQSGILDFFVRSLSSRNNIVGFQDYVVSSMYVGYLCDSILALIDIRPAGILHVASSSSKSKYEFGLEVGFHAGLDTHYIKPGNLDEMASMTSRGRDLGLSTKKISSILDKQMPSLTKSLIRAFKERSDIMENVIIDLD